MTNRAIIITGASDGIGRALAWEMARRGYKLGLTARRLDVLEQIQSAIQDAYPNCQVEVAALDVTDYANVEPTIVDLKGRLGQLDIVVANAGIAKLGVVGNMPVEQHLSVVDTNVNGAIATISAALKIFREQGHGHIVGSSSMAGYRGLPRMAAYSASKAALSAFLEGVQAETYKENIDVTILHPGYIDTAINRDLASRPFVIGVEKGARIFADLIEKKVASATVPQWPWCMAAPLLKYLPTSLIARM